MSEVEAEMTDEEAAQAVYVYAAQQLESGMSPAQLRAELTSMGLDEDSAAHVVSDIQRLKKEVEHEDGMKHVVVGLLWCLGGIAVTALTYQHAAAHGGVYVVAWGAIAFGGLQFLYGLFKVAAPAIDGAPGAHSESGTNLGAPARSVTQHPTCDSCGVEYIPGEPCACSETRASSQATHTARDPQGATLG